MPTDRPAGWSRAQRRLHWWTAALVVLGFAVAWLMVAVPISALLEKFLLYQLHKTIGLLVWVLVLWRIIVRLSRGRPDWDAALPDYQRRVAGAAHLLLYGLLLATPVLGYFVAATAPAQVPTLFLGVIAIPHVVGPDEAAFAILRQVHRAAAVALVLLASGHGLMAWQHHRQGRATLAMMWRGG